MDSNEKSGAITTSINKFLIFLAACEVSFLLNATIPPNALILSQLSALSKAICCFLSRATPQGLPCFKITHEVLGIVGLTP